MTSPLRVIPAAAALSAAVLFVSLFAPLAAAQGTGTIGGRVTDGITGRPVDGVQVYVAGTELGTVTNADGRYQLNLPAGTAELRTRRVGYATIVSSPERPATRTSNCGRRRSAWTRSSSRVRAPRRRSGSSAILW